MASKANLSNAENGADFRFVAYLDRLCEPLQRTLSPDALAAYRLETLSHLEMLAMELEQDGWPPSDAVEQALKEYGQPDLLSIAYLDEWCKGSRPVGFARGAKSATLWSFVWFGIASALSLIAIQVGTMIPGMSWFLSIAQGLFWVLPVLAGILTGFTVPTGNLRAICFAMMPVALHTIIVAQVMQSTIDAPRLGTFQMITWLPIGCVATYGTALLRRRPRFANRSQGVA